MRINDPDEPEIDAAARDLWETAFVLFIIVAAVAAISWWAHG